MRVEGSSFKEPLLASRERPVPGTIVRRVVSSAVDSVVRPRCAPTPRDIGWAAYDAYTQGERSVAYSGRGQPL